MPVLHGSFGPAILDRLRTNTAPFYTPLFQAVKYGKPWKQMRFLPIHDDAGRVDQHQNLNTFRDAVGVAGMRKMGRHALGKALRMAVATTSASPRSMSFDGPILLK